MVYVNSDRLFRILALALLYGIFANRQCDETTNRNETMQLTQQQRETINLLVGNMFAANKATPYDAHGYDANQAAYQAFLRSILGNTLFEAIDDTHTNWNWGGNNNYADDAQAAIDNAIAEQAAIVEQAIAYRIENLLVKIAACTTTEKLDNLFQTVPFSTLVIEEIAEAFETQTAIINATIPN